ncbi:MAG: hypothetical protein R6X07_02325 [Desulfatiglandales bacterium]|jgi:hypothetical protein
MMESFKLRRVLIPAVFLAVQKESLPAESPHENERVEGIIKSLEQKYGR